MSLFSNLLLTASAPIRFMVRRHTTVHRIRIVCLAVLLAAPGFAQQRTAAPVPAPAVAPAAAPDEETVNRMRRQLMDMLRMSPRLTEVLSRDASLIGDADYIQRKNPELARYLEQHPEIVRNPEFYLFGGHEGYRLDDVRWNGSVSERERVVNRLMNDIGPVIALFIFFLGGLWLLRLIMDNLRWKRVLHLQTEVHNKLLDKLGSSQELLAYMQTDAGKRFLEGAPVSVALTEAEPQWGSPVARIMRPLQAGIVLAAAGVGFMINGYDVLQIIGKIALMIGFGFIISAAASWLIARQSGLLDHANDATNRAL
jgi:hypothetical protein